MTGVQTCALPISLAERREVGGFLWGQRANALRLCGPREDEAAQRAFERAVDIDPDNAGWWFDLGLLHKWRGRFKRGYDCNLKALARLDEADPRWRAAQWNLAICATAIGDGDVAGGVWKRLGMPAALTEASGMPLVEGLPPMQVRVLSRGTGRGLGSAVPDAATVFEVVWVAPLSPCHGVVQSPTFRDAPIDYGDVVLWDGAPVHVTETSDGPVPCFALLEILRRGDERRFSFVALQTDAGDVAGLEETLPEGTRVFVHRERVERGCPTCASGAGGPHVHAPEAPPPEARVAYGKVIVPAAADLRTFRVHFERTSRKGGHVVMALPELYEALGETRRAGQEHRAWRGIEKTALRKGLVAG